jgi:hypothetical protein
MREFVLLTCSTSRGLVAPNVLAVADAPELGVSRAQACPAGVPADEEHFPCTAGKDRASGPSRVRRRAPRARVPVC